MTPPLVQLLDLSHNFISRIPYQVILQETHSLWLFCPEYIAYVLSLDNYPSVPGSPLALPPILGHLLQPPGRPRRLQLGEPLQPPDPSPPPQQDLQHPEAWPRQHSNHRSELQPGAATYIIQTFFSGADSKIMNLRLRACSLVSLQDSPIFVSLISRQTGFGPCLETLFRFPFLLLLSANKLAASGSFLCPEEKLCWFGWLQHFKATITAQLDFPLPRRQIVISA